MKKLALIILILIITASAFSCAGGRNHRGHGRGHCAEYNR